MKSRNRPTAGGPGGAASVDEPWRRCSRTADSAAVRRSSENGHGTVGGRDASWSTGSDRSGIQGGGPSTGNSSEYLLGGLVPGGAQHGCPSPGGDGAERAA